MMYSRDILYDYNRILQNCKLTDEESGEALQAYGDPQTHQEAVRNLTKWIQSDSSMVSDDVLFHLREMAVDMDEPFAFMVDDIQWLVRWYTIEGESTTTFYERLLSACSNPDLINKYPQMCLKGIGRICVELPKSEQQDEDDAINENPSLDKRMEERLYILNRAMEQTGMIKYLTDYDESDIEDLVNYYRYAKKLWQDTWAFSSNWESSSDYAEKAPHFASVAFWANPNIVHTLQTAIQEKEDMDSTGEMIDLYGNMEDMLRLENTWNMVWKNSRHLVPGLMMTLLNLLSENSASPTTTAFSYIPMWFDQFNQFRKQDAKTADTLLLILQRYWETDAQCQTHLQPLSFLETPTVPTDVRTLIQLEQWNMVQSIIVEYGTDWAQYSKDKQETLSTSLELDP